ncbi:MAG: dual specificity protein phosphatase family protein [Chloroflexi bacterium]|nr:dual specificity protein phosphatase family protein [Chloroflexota bacterium]
MNEIRPWLFIGNYYDTLDRRYLDFKSIQAMLQLAEAVEQDGINSLHLTVEDMGPVDHGVIRQGVDFILRERELGHRVLVACGAGINRSTMFCIAALKESEGLGLLDAYREICKRHPEAMPNEPVWESFCGYYNESTPYLDVMRASIPNL